MIIVALRNIICIAALFCLLPVFAILSILLVAEDGFPIFFIQKRLGIEKRVFKIFKIRTMKKNTPQLGTHDVGEEYKLKTGILIRATKFDEFPQLANVILGDINLVGPRPGLLTQTELLNDRSLKDIYSIKPGITGLSQILGYDMSNPEELSLVDRVYLDNKSNSLDLIILLGTFFQFPRNYLAAKYKIHNNK